MGARENKTKQLIERLIDRARTEGWMIFGDRYKRSPQARAEEVGQLILRLPKEERALLKDFTVEDIAHRMDEAALIYVPRGSTGERKGRLGKHLEEQRQEHERKRQEAEDKKRYK